MRRLAIAATIVAFVTAYLDIRVVAAAAGLIALVLWATEISLLDTRIRTLEARTQKEPHRP